MKTLKAKLLLSVLSLLLATALISATSFAWYTLSIAPEMSGISATVAVNENLEMALALFDGEGGTEDATLPPETDEGDAGNCFRWGNLVSFLTDGEAKDAFDAILALYSEKAEVEGEDTEEDETDEEDAPEGFILRPMTFDKKTQKFIIPEYGKNGRVKTNADGSLKSGGNLTIDETYGFGRMYRTVKAYDDKTKEEKDVEVNYGFYLDFWLRSNAVPEEGKTTLPLILVGTAGEERSTQGAEGNGCVFTVAIPEDTDDALKETFENLAENLRVAFQDVTPDIEGATASTSSSIYLPDFASEVTEDEDGYKLTFDTAKTEGDSPEKIPILSLTQNEAKLLRVYIYLDGVELENPDAMLELEEIGASLNLQFKLDRATDLQSMDAE